MHCTLMHIAPYPLTKCYSSGCPPCHVTLQQLAQQILCFHGHSRPRVGLQVHGFCLDHVKQPQHRGILKRWIASQQSVQHHPHTPQVAGLAITLIQDLWRHVSGAASHLSEDITCIHGILEVGWVRQWGNLGACGEPNSLHWLRLLATSLITSGEMVGVWWWAGQSMESEVGGRRGRAYQGTFEESVSSAHLHHLHWLRGLCMPCTTLRGLCMPCEE